MLYGRQPLIPPAIRKEWTEQQFSFEEEDQPAVVEAVLARAALLQKHMPIAMGNLRSAQHKDTLRYAEVRTGHFRPKLKKFEVGDFVWVRHRQQTALEIGVKEVVYRVLEVKDSGVLKLQGKCGTCIDVHMTHCAPCHLPGLDPTIDVTLARPSIHKFCEVYLQAWQQPFPHAFV